MSHSLVAAAKAAGARYVVRDDAAFCRMRFVNGSGKMQAIAKHAAARSLFWLGSPRKAVSIEAPA
jgi:hypothetical protein